MTDLTLTIGDKELSSWSLRPWLAMKVAGVPFTEETIRLDRPESRGDLNARSPSGLVPFLTHAADDGERRIWDSLAICEYVNDLYPEKSLWPQDTAARGVARAVSAEMHSGFSALRTVWPMMFTRRDLRHTTSGGVKRDLTRIFDLWRLCRTEFGSGGDFLFGAFTIADAMYAPVVSRIRTYGPVEMDAVSSRYCDAIAGLPAMAEWAAGAERELAESRS